MRPNWAGFLLPANSPPSEVSFAIVVPFPLSCFPPWLCGGGKLQLRHSRGKFQGFHATAASDTFEEPQMTANFRRLALALLLSSVATGAAVAQSTLRIGIAEDPDV